MSSRGVAAPGAHREARTASRDVPVGDCGSRSDRWQGDLDAIQPQGRGRLGERPRRTRSVSGAQRCSRATHCSWRARLRAGGPSTAARPAPPLRRRSRRSPARDRNGAESRDRRSARDELVSALAAALRGRSKALGGRGDPRPDAATVRQRSFRVPGLIAERVHHLPEWVGTRRHRCHHRRRRGRRGRRNAGRRTSRGWSGCSGLGADAGDG